MIRQTLLALCAPLLATVALGATVNAQSRNTGPLVERSAIVPAVDAHQHLMSPAIATRQSEVPPPTVTLPSELRDFLQTRINASRDKAALAALYTERAWLLESFNPGFIQTRDSIVDWWVGSTDSPYDLVPVGYDVNGSAAYITSYLTDSRTRKRDAHMVQSMTKGADGRWRIMTEVLTMGGPRTVVPITADYLVALLDTAGIQRAVVHSLAYQFGSGRNESPAEYENVKAENDWTAEQAGRFPDRLLAFCSFNPIKTYALVELTRCANSGRFRGVKLHMGNSRVDFDKPADVERLRAVFAAASARKLPIVIHLATYGTAYGRKGAMTFLQRVLPAAPDITIQIAHLASPGRLDPTSDSALVVFADAVTAGDPRVKNMIFDVTTVIDPKTSAARLKLVASRLRQLGMSRILYGSDTPDPEHMKPHEGWAAFRDRLGLTDDELRTIATNVPAYARP
jgi:predicted TIM-barrel fold metal-dependent hydrolase